MIAFAGAEIQKSQGKDSTLGFYRTNLEISNHFFYMTNLDRCIPVTYCVEETMVLPPARFSTRGRVSSKKYADKKPSASFGGGDELHETIVDKQSRSKRQLPRINNPIKILMRSRSNKKKDGRLEKFSPLRNSKANDLNTTGLSMTDSSNAATACLDLSMASSPTSGNNVDDSSVHTEHESFTQLDVPEMLCRKESGLTQMGIESSDFVLTRTSSYKDPNAATNVSREMENIVRPKSQNVSQSKESTDRMGEQNENATDRQVHSNNEETAIEHSPAAWLPPLDLDYLMSLTNADVLPTRDDRPVTEIHVPLTPKESPDAKIHVSLPPQESPDAKISKSSADKDFERKQRDEIFRHFLDDTTFGEKSRQESFPRRVRTNMTGGLSNSDFLSSLPEEIEIKSDLTTVPSSGGMRLRKVQSAWTPARARRTKLAMQEKELFLSKKSLKALDKPSFDNAVPVVKPCLVQTKSLNEKYEEDTETDSLMNFPTNGEKLFGSAKTVASTIDSSSIYATSDDLDTNSVPEIGVSCGGLFCGHCIEMNKQPVRNGDESVHSEDFSILLRKQIGTKRNSTELINEIRSEVLETVQQLARGGSTVVREFVAKRGK